MMSLCDHVADAHGLALALDNGERPLLLRWLDDWYLGCLGRGEQKKVSIQVWFRVSLRAPCKRVNATCALVAVTPYPRPVAGRRRSAPSHARSAAHLGRITLPPRRFDPPLCGQRNGW